MTSISGAAPRRPDRDRSARECGDRTAALRAQRPREALGMALVEARDGFAEAVGGEDLRTDPRPALVHLEQRDLVELREAEVGQAGLVQPFDRPDVPIERERVAERRQHLLTELQAVGPQRGSPRPEHFAPPVAGAGRMVEDVQRLVEELRERAGFARGEQGSAPFEAARRGVRAHAAGGKLRHRTRGQLVEARERRRFLSDVEDFAPRDSAVGSEQREIERGALEGASAAPQDAEARAAPEQRVGAEREHVVDADARGLGELVPRAEAALELPRPDRLVSDEAVVDGLEVGGDRPFEALHERRRQHRLDRAPWPARRRSAPSTARRGA
jgi:hypothetical protein